ncbi:helix-hairpin-helix domain-containing protein [Chryseobacterium wangxinyae]|uniref:hypothetical protein n=1 Tax=Chryseobacterium sp. CY353 TaxID=2997334 RepID=UPI00226DE8D3|nr:hypothetical protein [Chryseobacterium sp. CY353]MCY0970797.1 hypothetical protein [Chryseobacterium sp. CY353]
MAKSIKHTGNDHHAVSTDFLKGIIAMPARRALEREKIDSLKKLSACCEDEILQLHGFGENTLKKLKNHMSENQISFKK